MVDTGFIILTVDFSLGHQATEILKTFVVHGKEGDMEALLIVSWVAIFAAASGNIGLQAENRLDSGIVTVLIKLD